MINIFYLTILSFSFEIIFSISLLGVGKSILLNMAIAPITINIINVILIKTTLVLIIIIGVVVLLGKIDFPSPNKEIEKIIPNEKLKIVK